MFDPSVKMLQKYIGGAPHNEIGVVFTWGEMPSFGKIGLRKLVPETQLKHFLHLLTCVEITSDNIFFG